MGAMKKKTAKKSKAKDKKSGSNKKNKAVKAELNPGQVLKDISLMIEQEAPQIAMAVIGEGKKGQLSQAKYLFEMARIYPQPADVSAPTEDEDSLAKTLLNRLKIPLEPVVHDELLKEEDEDAVTEPKKEAVSEAEEKDEEEEQKPVTVH